MRRILLALALMLAPAAQAQTVNADQAAALRVAIERGRLLYDYDQAAWHGTDDMLTRIKDPQDKVGGWIVDGKPGATELVFYDKDAADPHAVYVARFDGSKLLSSRVLAPNEDRSLSPLRKRMIAAIRIASDALVGAQVQRCAAGQRFNTVTLPPKTENGPISVYYLTPQPDLKTVPFGGHYRIDVSADGKAGPVRPFTKSCIAIPIDAGKAKDSKSAMLTISHLLDPTPTEIHVFSSLVAHLPVMVVTGSNRAWAVDGDRSIRPFDLGAK